MVGLVIVLPDFPQSPRPCLLTASERTIFCSEPGRTQQGLLGICHTSAQLASRAKEHSRLAGAKEWLEPNAQKEHVPRLYPEGTELKRNHVCDAHAHLESGVRCTCVYGVAPVEARVWNTRNRFQEESCLVLFFVFVFLAQPKSKQLYLTA